MHSRKLIDLTGQQHGKLTVIDRELDPSKRLGRATTWYCMCECGETVYVRTHQLTSGRKRCCGCNNKVSQRKIDLLGQKFGMLTVIAEKGKRVLKNGNKKIEWSCECECGNITTATTGMLRGGYKQSCGCLRGKKRRENAARAEEQTRREKADKKAQSLLSDSRKTCGCGQGD